MPVIEVRSKEELEKVRSSIKGPVVLEFVDEKNCDACIDEAPRVEKAVNACAGDVTLVKVPVDLGGSLPEADKLADEFNADALPALFHAASASDLQPGKAKEVEDSTALKKLIKCSRK